MLLCHTNITLLFFKVEQNLIFIYTSMLNTWFGITGQSLIKCRGLFAHFECWLPNDSDAILELPSSNHHNIVRKLRELLESSSILFHSLNAVERNTGESRNTHDDAIKKLCRLKSLLGVAICFYIYTNTNTLTNILTDALQDP